MIALPVFFLRLDCSLFEPEETRYAEISRQMLVGGHWLVPTLHGQPYYDKPPLLYWLIMGSYRVFGAHDWAARLVCSGAAFLCVLVTYAWGKRVVGTRPALIGALILCLSVQFVYLGRMVTMNGLVCLCIATALALAHRALLEDRICRSWWYLSAVVCGLGMLTKGPLAFVLTLLPLALLHWCDEDLARPTCRHWIGFVVVALGVAAPWYLALAIIDHGFLHYFFWVHHVERFLVPFDHAQPFWYYLPWLLLGMFPATLLLPGLLRSWYPDIRSRRPEANIPRLAAAQRVFLMCAVSALLFFSLSGCKRKGYILPAMPPLALALGCHLDSLLSATDAARARFWRRASSWAWCAAAMFVLIIGTIGLALPWYARQHSLRDQVLPLADSARDLPVLCYPHLWDSVGFYLERVDVETMAPTQHDRLLTCLQQNRKVLMVVKTELLPAFLADLPAAFEFVPAGERSLATAGWVQRR